MPGANIIAQASSPVSEQRGGHFHSDFMFSVVAFSHFTHPQTH